MTIDRVRIGKVRRYFADGERLSVGALTAMLEGMYGKEVCKQIFYDLIETGSVIIEHYTSEGNAGLIDQLELAEKKIAALEKKASNTRKLALLEECKSLPMGAVYDYFCNGGVFYYKCADCKHLSCGCCCRKRGKRHCRDNIL